MNKSLKRTLIALTVTTVFSSSAFAAKITSNALTGSEIHGYRPYMKSIGSKIVTGGMPHATKPGVFLPAVGAIIEIPTYSKGSDLFDFGEKDGDLPAMLGADFKLPNGDTVTGETEFVVKWFIVTPKSGFKFEDESGEGKVIASANDVEWLEIEGEFIAGNPNSKSLVVPETAAGKRLGFEAIPTSEYGLPKTGTPIKAWDLSKLWSQEEPKTPGECTEGSTDPNCNNNGGPGEDNGNGGGGAVQTPEGVITIYNENGVVVQPGDPLLVDSSYFATIRIKDGDVYRDPTTKEAETIEWHIVDKANNPIASYGKDDATRVDIEGLAKGPAGLKGYTFKTQKINTDAKDPLQNTAPNYSEQGWGIQVSIETDE